ncbi:MlaD family protein [Sciscionella marina]|uniref:MlaD family protein n=1 Tax=Sciscionella marina TaxID=508770 RepID=UPI00035F1600|nr:MlaD family protein [Sciscionella marina]
MKQRMPIIRLIAFIVVGFLAAGLVVAQTVGQDALSGTYRVSMHLPETGGIVQNSQVTYRGTPIGTVDSVTIDPGGNGITLELAIKTEYRIPKDTMAAVSMDVPIAIEHVDLQPRTDSGPYLADGDTIPARDTELPVPFDRFLKDGTDLLSTIDTKDLAKVGDEAQDALSGMEPQLHTLLRNSEQLMGTTEEITPQLIDLTDRGTATIQKNQGLVDQLPALAKKVRGMTADMKGLTPKAGALLTDGNAMIRRIMPILNRNQRSIALIVSNLANVTQVLSLNLPTLAGSLTDGPKGINDFSSVFFPSPLHPGVTDAAVDLTGAPGPVCYYGTQRRTPQQTGSRPVEANWNCPGDKQYLQQRGSVNAPRSPTNPEIGTYDPKTRIATRQDGSKLKLGDGKPPVTGPQSWSAVMMQGIQ